MAQHPAAQQPATSFAVAHWKKKLAGDPENLRPLDSYLFWYEPFNAQTHNFHKKFAGLMYVGFGKARMFRVKPAIFACSYLMWCANSLGLPQQDDTFLASLVAVADAYWMGTIRLGKCPTSSQLGRRDYAQEAVTSMYEGNALKRLRNHAYFFGTDNRPADDTTYNQKFISQCNFHVSDEQKTSKGYPLVCYRGPSSGTRSGVRGDP